TSRTLVFRVEASGLGVRASETKSRAQSPFSADTGSSNDRVRREKLMRRIAEQERPASSAAASREGARPDSCARAQEAAWSFRSSSTALGGRRIVLEESAMARRIPCWIHQMA